MRMITQKQEKTFLTYLEQNMKVELVFKKSNVFYVRYIGTNEYGGAAAYIAGAKHVAKIAPEEVQVLAEYPTKPGKRKYAFHGDRQVAKMLSTIYGGFVLLDVFWMLDNIKDTGNNPFGYNSKVSSIFEIDGERIVEQINNMQLNCYVVTLQQLQKVQ